MKTNILYINDSEEDVKLVAGFLKKSSLKYDFHCAETLRKGIQFCEEKEVNLVLLDLYLPDSKGTRTLSTFLDELPDIPVIVISDASVVDAILS